MRKFIRRKLSSRSGGVNRLVLILALAVLVLFAAIVLVAVRSYFARAELYGCTIAVKKAQDMLDEEYMFKGFTDLDDGEARAIVDRSMVKRDALCPGGGDYYIINNPGRAATAVVVCGIHDTDLKQRTRLNAQNVLNQLRKAVETERLMQRDDPETITVSLNSQDLTAELVTEETDLVRGTFSTSGYRGTVAFYMLDEDGVSYLSFADEDHCANWKKGEGWTGDSYNK